MPAKSYPVLERAMLATSDDVPPAHRAAGPMRSYCCCNPPIRVGAGHARDARSM